MLLYVIMNALRKDVDVVAATDAPKATEPHPPQSSPASFSSPHASPDSPFATLSHCHDYYILLL
jgi:hypothetical protein